MMMKQIHLTLVLLVMALTMSAQEQQHEKFSPEKFDAELQEYITQEAQLTPQEAAKFFPVYREMQQKQRALFDRQRELGKNKPQDEEACRKAIEERDGIDLELKRIQQEYHKKFFELLPASKVYDILKAEERFHRRMMKNWGRNNAPQHRQGGNGPRPQRPQKH